MSSPNNEFPSNEQEDAFTGQFRLSILRALTDQLAEKLSELKPAPLTEKNLDEVQRRPGVYELYLHGDRVYVGKADKNLRQRLGKHLKKLSGRTGVALGEVRFLALYVDEDLEAAAPEKLLIKKYRDQGGAPWNTNGFGSNDPGVKRDDTLVPAKHFDAKYPVNLDQEISELRNGVETVEKFLNAVKRHAPYLLRFEKKDDTAIAELKSSHIDVPARPLTMRECMAEVVRQLPGGWQATAFPGYVTLYPVFREYDSARTYWRRYRDEVAEFAGPAKLDYDAEVNLPDDGE